ncbi:hypothetical protein LguiB_035331 [Lonicera macranthoides]
MYVLLLLLNIKKSMAEELYDGEFWLPPQFLTDDDILTDFTTTTTNRSKGYDCFAPKSDQSSPVESVLGSTETESDEDDFISGYTRKMSQSNSSLPQQDFWKPDSSSFYDNPKTWVMDGSPQSTLCSVFGKQGSSRGSTNCSSQVSSPPSAPLGTNRSDVAWDLLYAAADEVAKMRVSEERAGGYYQNRAILGATQKPSPISVPLKNPNPNSGFHSNRLHHQLQANQFEQLKQQRMKAMGRYQQNQTHQMVQNRASSSSTSSVRPVVGLSPCAWPTLQQSQQQLQQPGSGMRAVFLGNPGGAKRDCTGTGVFLPRTPTQNRKKPGCSTVLLPERVVQALNLKLESIDSPPQLHQPTSLSSEYGKESALIPNYLFITLSCVLCSLSIFMRLCIDFVYLWLFRSCFEVSEQCAKSSAQEQCAKSSAQADQPGVTSCG